MNLKPPNAAAIYKWRVFTISFAAILGAMVLSPAVTGCSGGTGGASPDPSAVREGTIYYIDDHLGSAQLIADAESGVIYEEVIYPYGLGAESGGGPKAGADYSFTTKERDGETGLIYFGARYYSPDLGRWISPDPLFLQRPEATTKEASSSNLYMYVRNNPVNLIDPFGLEAWSIKNRWDAEQVQAYSSFMGGFISSYDEEIDCADLGLKGLIGFASENQLPLSLRYRSDGDWRYYDAASDDFDSVAQYEKTVLTNMGALNIIDNTSAVGPSELRAGDFVMSRWSSTLGHTRVVYTLQYDLETGDTGITWYQGNLPPVVPQRRTADLSDIDPGTLPSSEATRRWDFEDWND